MSTSTNTLPPAAAIAVREGAFGASRELEVLLRAAARLEHAATRHGCRMTSVTLCRYPGVVSRVSTHLVRGRGDDMASATTARTVLTSLGVAPEDLDDTEFSGGSGGRFRTVRGPVLAASGRTLLEVVVFCAPAPADLAGRADGAR